MNSKKICKICQKSDDWVRHSSEELTEVQDPRTGRWVSIGDAEPVVCVYRCLHCKQDYSPDAYEYLETTR